MVLANIFLLLAVLCMALSIGGGVYEGLVINPQWSASPPQSFALIQEGTGIPLQKFWIPAHIVISIFILAALYFNWHISHRRTLIIAAIVSYGIMRAWSFAYFIPEMLSFQKVPLDSGLTDELMIRVERWKNLSWWRSPLDLISFMSLVWALTYTDFES
ncbi:MAG: hypothetical protein AABY64_09150 [Bdellovibrionota bacterium]